MIKKNSIFITLFLSSCAFIDYSTLPSITKSIVLGAEDINVTQEFYQDQKYSFVKAKIGRHSIVIFVLSRVDEKRFHWIASDGSKLVTLRDGRPIQLTSSIYNFQIIPATDYINISSTQMPYEYFISLEDPKAYFNQASTLSFEGLYEINYLNEKISVNYVKEEVNSLSMKWNYVNRFYTNNSGLGVRSELYFNPLVEKLELSFYYKF